MHGHAQSGSRKLNRHWQSGSGKFELEENLVWLDREIVETVWPTDDFPYWVRSAPLSSNEVIIHNDYARKNPERNKQGIKPLIITEPGDYQLHWNLSFDEVTSTGMTGQNRNNDCGMYGAVMYGLATPERFKLSPYSYYTQTLYQGSIKYYAGTIGDYLAFQNGKYTGDTDGWGGSEYFENVRPSRSSTYRRFFTAYSLNIASSEETPPIIFHIGDKAPFTTYKISYDTYTKEAWFDKLSNYFSPYIKLLFTQTSDFLYAVTGKIWLERIGDFTDTQEGWMPRITEVPDGWIIKGDGGIV